MDLEALSSVRGGTRLREALLRMPLVYSRRPKAYWYRREANFGDQLSPRILSWILGVDPVWVSARYRGKLLGIGSILDALAPRDIVFGSGLISGEMTKVPAGVEVLAVRGPLTRSKLMGDVPEAYGDPAILLPMFYAPRITVRDEIGIVPHYADYARVSTHLGGYNVLNVTRPWEEVVQAIRACSVVVSSSLHGLIVAEAYGIPASRVRVSDDVVGGDFKFDDYYLSTGRESQPPQQLVDARSIEAALRRLPEPVAFDPTPLLNAAKQLRDRAARGPMCGLTGHDEWRQ